MDEYIKIFLNIMKIEEKVNVTVHLYDNKEHMHEARINMTSDALLKEALKVKGFAKPCGCYIIPPVSNNNYDILLVRSDLIVYDLWHEMMHVYNYYQAMKKGWSYMEMCTNTKYFNWDEFQARKISTIMWFEFLERSNKITLGQDSFDRLAEILKNEIPDSEYKEDKKYNLVQYLGFIAAAEELCGDSYKLPLFVLETPEILKLYNDFNKTE